MNLKLSTLPSSGLRRIFLDVLRIFSKDGDVPIPGFHATATPLFSDDFGKSDARILGRSAVP
jgi:hypothetical protein